MPAKTLKLRPPEPSEQQIQNAVAKVFLLHGWACVRLNGGGFYDTTGRFVSGYTIMGLGAHAGLPDLLCWRGVVLSDGQAIIEALLIEVKRPGGKLSEAQARCHAYLRQKGVTVRVLTSSDEARRLLAELEAE